MHYCWASCQIIRTKKKLQQDEIIQLDSQKIDLSIYLVAKFLHFLQVRQAKQILWHFPLQSSRLYDSDTTKQESVFWLKLLFDKWITQFKNLKWAPVELTVLWDYVNPRTSLELLKDQRNCCSSPCKWHHPCMGHQVLLLTTCITRYAILTDSWVHAFLSDLASVHLVCCLLSFWKWWTIANKVELTMMTKCLVLLVSSATYSTSRFVRLLMLDGTDPLRELLSRRLIKSK